MGTRVTAVIVTYRSAETIATCLRSLPAGMGMADGRAVVVDNASDDTTLEEVRLSAAGVELPVEVVALPGNAGFAAGANAGLARADGDYVLFLNPDAVLAADTVAELIDVTSMHDRAGIVSPTLVNSDGSPQPMIEDDITLVRALAGMVRLRPAVRPRTAPADGPPCTVDWIHAACILMRRELAQRLGGFDERFFFGGEDMDLCRRVREAGYQVLVVPEVRVTHIGGASVAKGDTAVARHRVDAVATAFEIRYGRWAARLFALVAFVVYGVGRRRDQASAARAVLRRRSPR